MIEITIDLKDIVICALRYALGRRTYVTGLTVDFIMNNPDLIDDRVRRVMKEDLEEYFECRGIYYNDDECDYRSWRKLYEWLGENE